MSRLFSSIPSPYNFVPLSSKIVFPDWADRVSHDIPFSDGMDGVIEITITADSPVYIRNGGIWNKTNCRDSSEYQEFFCAGSEGKYYIPGSSIKGVIRSVLEIASFGKMQHADDKRYSIRDLHLKAYTGKISEQVKSSSLKGFRPKVKSGWLDISGDEWKITPCEFARIERSLIGTNFANRRMSAMDKYEEYFSREKAPVRKKCTIEEEKAHGGSSNNGLLYRKVLDFNGKQDGYLVFTGQPQEYRPGSQQKHLEFFFFNEQKSECHIVSSGIKKDFLFIHEDSQEWKFWQNKDKEKIELYRLLMTDFAKHIPVFYLENEKRELQSLGLAMMYRLPYSLSTGEAIRNTNPEHFNFDNDTFKPDMADLIFGYSTKSSSLRGRVQFEHMEAVEIPQEERETVVTVQGNPRPTFYPNYVKQKDGDIESSDDYQTFMNKNAKIRGWKRYPVTNYFSSKRNLPRENRENEEMNTKFRPLPAGTKFRGKIHFHNLRPIEMGTLLWALTWGGNSHCRHSVGLCKPYGFGVVNIQIENLSPEISSSLDKFKLYMDEQLGETWIKTEEIRQLMLMANKSVKNNWDFSYLPEPKNFGEAKGNKQRDEEPLTLKPYYGDTANNSNHGQNRPVAPMAVAEKTPAGAMIEDMEKQKLNNPTELRKQLDKINELTLKEYERIASIVGKRTDYKNKYSKTTSDYKDSLRKLSTRVKDK